MVRKSRQSMPPGGEFDTSLIPKALTKQEFGRRLQALILEKNWNQSDAARATGLGRDSISTYVNGKTFPTPRALKTLADALGVKTEELLPNAMMQAMDDEHPAIELKQATGHPGKAWLRINRAMSFSTAAKIIELINQEDA
ncbi:HipB Predicted transcriptional regulators [uncultured Caudovirales phage]|uniref:HipB Predicted transcriptional regulators n=1 Tax=uncultured Caudovirales phage TaxID=2100421 RepID=A0A6J7VJZ0_9CAUD|nr:HipB Predicted transcriptional regulators [uncultured Caudovirales phage]CAB4241225.1 HipB Predicted transcriptional regulators [uncultured Caudovirales phage]CAB5078975.1 HipB Predicted transcriptional regulators [uncultured Caudovirales phage]